MDSPKEDVQRVTKLLEESKQEAHELRSRLQISERCVHDYEAELEALQQDAEEKDRSHAAAIREIEEGKSNALREAEKRVESLELEVQILSEKLATVHRQLEEKSVNKENLTDERNDTAALYVELQETMEALAMSTAACNQHKEFISVLQNEKQEFAQRVEMLEENLEYYKENLSILKSQLSTQMEEFKELQEQLAITQSELVALKATPDVKSRGNSLFAEVEDNRQQMAKDYKIMLAKFGFMKKDYAEKCSQIAKLKKEKTILTDKLEFAERDAKKHYRAFVENYEIRIKELEFAVCQLKNDVKPVYLNGNDEILKFAEQTVVNSRKEVLSLREEMEMRSALRLSEAADLLRTRGELAQARADLRISSLNIAELVTTLNERGIDQPSKGVVDHSSRKEMPTVKVEVPERIAMTTFSSVTKQKPKDIVFEDELLPAKFSSWKRDVKVEKVKVLKPMDEVSTSLNEAMDDTNESPRNGHCWLKEDGIDIGVDIVGDPKVLDGESVLEQDVSLEKSFEADAKMKVFECSMQDEWSARNEEVDEVLPQLENDDFLAPLILSPSSSKYLDAEVEMKIESMLNVTFSPLSDGKNGLTGTKPVRVRQSDNSGCGNSVSNLDSPAEMLCFLSPPIVKESSNVSLIENDSIKREATSPILKGSSKACFIENKQERLQKEVDFEEVSEKLVRDTENLGMKDEEADESNKENSVDIKVDNDREEKKTARRRPRPKQAHPIIYIT